MDVPQFIAGRFRIECVIGTGGMGTVYRATHLGLQRPVAVKIIKPEFATDADVAERFLREARTMARLRHAHAAMIFDAGSLPDGRHFIVMEFVEGPTLSEVLLRDGQFSPERTVEIAVQICDVLEEAHELGIIHRDLKPSNIMLNKRGVRVVDFGVAKVLASSAETTATHASTGSGQIIGTPRYMSPEQCLGQRVGARSDLYSLGVLLYEMLAGRPPFVDPLPSAVLVKQATAPPPPLPRLRPDIPRPLALAVHSLLAKRPEDRPRTAASARSILEKSLAKPSRHLPEVEPLSATVAGLAGGSSMFFRIGAPLALVMVFGALLLVWANSGETAPPARTNPSATSFPSPAPKNAIDSGNSEGGVAKLLAVSTKLPITTEQARKVAAELSPHGAIGNVEVLSTVSGPAVAAIHEERKAGTTHFFIVQKHVRTFLVTHRGALDVAGFRHASWNAETVDADMDGYDDVLFTGSSGERPGYRLVLYVPRSRSCYSLTVETRGRKVLRTIWSSNLRPAARLPYRNILRKRANSMVG